MTSQFLYQEYTECFSQLRYVDNKHIMLLKFSIIMTSSLTLAMMTVYKFLFENAPGSLSLSWLVFSLLSLVIFLGNTFIFISMLKNRVYHTHLARQLNAIRLFLMDNEIPEFKPFNQMYTSTAYGSFKLLSVQILMVFGVALLSAIFLSFFIFSFSLYKSAPRLLVPVISGILFFILQTFFAVFYLIQTDKKRKKLPLL